jgi:oxygen-independent coproporphyrinogen-3 oxidase
MSHDPCKKNRPVAAALYVHVPLCRRKCRYCDFYSRPHAQDAAQRFVRAATAELAARRSELAAPLASVFIGGGTPTALGGEELAELLGACRKLVDADTEFTVEANPGTIDTGTAEMLIGCGVNRVSMGAQSFQADELRTLGRTHAVEQIAQAVEVLRAGGIENINLDLIYGIPGQTPATWRESLRWALSLGCEHLSCYALSFEAGTPLARAKDAGELAEMAESLQRHCYYQAIDAAQNAGMRHYEISNFARPGRECRHNINYWKNKSYVGIGPAAASFIGQVRRTNHPDLQAYASAVLTGNTPPNDSECLTGRAAMAETVMLGLRLTQGVDIKDFISRFNQSPLTAFPQTVARYRQVGALVVDSGHLRLSGAHLFVTDSILADFLAEA